MGTRGQGGMVTRDASEAREGTSWQVGMVTWGDAWIRGFSVKSPLFSRTNTPVIPTPIGD
jgi:hypothetical protein